METTLFEPHYDLSPEQIGDVLVALGANSYRLTNNNVQADHCFLHHNNSPTLGVSIAWPYQWNCFNPICKKGPDLISLICRAMRLRDREDAFAWLAFTIPGIDTRKGALKFELRKDSPLSAPAPRFALSPAVLAAYSLSQSDDIGFRAIEYYGKLCTREQAVEYKLGYHLAEHRLIFPVFYSDGVLGGLIGRCMLKNCASHERWFNYDEGHFKKGRMLMGAERPIDKDKPLVVVEGPSDAIYLRARGIPNVLALMGCEFSDEQVALLLAYRQPIVPLFDDDTAGRAALAKFKKAVGNQTRLLPFQYPTSAYKEKKADPRQIPEECLPDLVASFGRLRFK